MVTASLGSPALAFPSPLPPAEALFNYARTPWGQDMLQQQIHQSVCITKGKMRSNTEQFLQHYQCAWLLLEVGDLKKTPGDGKRYASAVISDLQPSNTGREWSRRFSYWTISKGMDAIDAKTSIQVAQNMEWNKTPTDDRKMIYNARIAGELIFLSLEKDQFPNLILYRFFSLGIMRRD